MCVRERKGGGVSFSGDRDSRIPGARVPGLSGCRESWLSFPGDRDSRIPGDRDSRIPGSRVIGGYLKLSEVIGD